MRHLSVAEWYKNANMFLRFPQNNSSGKFFSTNYPPIVPDKSGVEIVAHKFQVHPDSKVHGANMGPT